MTKHKSKSARLVERKERLGIDRWVRESAERGWQIAQESLYLLDRIVRADDNPFFMVTVERVSDLYYAPVTTLSRQQVKRMLGNGSKEVSTPSLLEKIRNAFPIGILPHESQLFSVAFRNFDKRKYRSHMMVIHVEIEEKRKGSGKPTSQQEQYSVGEVRSAGYINLEDMDSSLEPVRPKILKTLATVGLSEKFAVPLMKLLRRAVRKEVCLFVCPDKSDYYEKSGDGRRFQLVQTGFFLRGTSTRELISKVALRRISNAVSVSRFATYNLLFEKERYFQKALRQAVRGRMLKFGVGRDICDEIRILRNLQAQDKFNVATVVKSSEDKDKEGEDDQNGDPEFAWYEMPLYTMSSLLDLLTSTEDLQNYEVASIVRSCFAHLRNTYWGTENVKKFGSRNTNAYLSAALALALEAAKKAREKISRDVAAILRGEPVRLARQIELFEKSSLRGVEPLVEVIESGFEKKVDILISGQTERCGGHRRYVNPETCLRRIGDSIRMEKYEATCFKAKMEDDRFSLHGDAHYGNFLVNANIPEDPLIISIDQKTVGFAPEDTERYRESVKKYCRYTELSREIEDIRFDPVYDIAGFMLSTTCGYGLAYRLGFELKVKPAAGTGAVCTLVRVSEDAFRKLSETGGISSSQLVKIEAPVCRDAWNYHKIGAEVSFDEFLKLQLEAYSELSGRDRSISINAGSVRLWLLTVYHSFSVAQNLCPRDIMRALVMYLLAVRFVNRGTGDIMEVISSRLNTDKSLVKLQKLFTSRLFEG